MAKRIESEVARVKQRVDSCEAVERIIFRVQMDSLAKAEQLRLLAIAAVNEANAKRGKTGALKRLQWFLGDLSAFHKHPLAGTKLAKKARR